MSVAINIINMYQNIISSADLLYEYFLRSSSITSQFSIHARVSDVLNYLALY